MKFFSLLAGLTACIALDALAQPGQLFLVPRIDLGATIGDNNSDCASHGLLLPTTVGVRLQYQFSELISLEAGAGTYQIKYKGCSPSVRPSWDDFDMIFPYLWIIYAQAPLGVRVRVNNPLEETAIGLSFGAAPSVLLSARGQIHEWAGNTAYLPAKGDGSHYLKPTGVRYYAAISISNDGLKGKSPGYEINLQLSSFPRNAFYQDRLPFTLRGLAFFNAEVGVGLKLALRDMPPINEQQDEPER